jgi:hypothetical protein
MASDRHAAFYDSMLIGVDKEKGELTGFFEDATGWDEQTKSPRYGKLLGVMPASKRRTIGLQPILGSRGVTSEMAK